MAADIKPAANGHTDSVFYLALERLRDELVELYSDWENGNTHYIGASQRLREVAARAYVIAETADGINTNLQEIA